MKIQCPHCGVKGSADDSYQGRQLKCPKCQGIFAAVPEVAVVVPEEMPPLVEPVEEAAEPVAAAPPDLPGDAAPLSGAGDPEDILADDIAPDETAVVTAEEGEDLADILAFEDKMAQNADAGGASAKPAAAGDDVLDWSDIVSEIDEEMAEDARREKGSEGDPATLHDFFADAAPAAGDAARANAELETEDQVEETTPGGDNSEALAMAAPSLLAGQAVGQSTTPTSLAEVEDQPYGLAKEQCWQCGKKDSVGVPFIAKDGRLYCPDCLPPEKSPQEESDALYSSAMNSVWSEIDTPQDEQQYSFSIVGLLREAWAKTKGVKAAIWAGTAVMYVALLFFGTASAFLLPSPQPGGAVSLGGILSGIVVYLIFNMVMVVFLAGLLGIGIKKVAGENFTWKTVFEGFSVAGKLIGAFILQTLLVIVGFCLLVLPGIYLTIGYAMTIPLIVDRKMSPWQAMETSRKAIHGHWWKIFGLSIVMALIYLVSTIPLGIGLVWTWPMFVVLGGVVYRSLFGIETKC